MSGHQKGRSWSRTGVVFSICFLILAVPVVPVRADLLAVDQFDYTLNGNVGGQNGGSGFTGAWGFSTAAPSISTAKIIAGLTFSDLAVSGNAAMLNVVSSSSSGFADTVECKRHPGGVPIAGEEFWYRYLFHMDANITANSFQAGLMIKDSSQTFHKFGTFGLSGVGNGRGAVNVDPSVVNAASGSPSLSDTGTYLMIAKFTGINAGTNVARTGTWWALSVSDYDAIKADGITEAELNAHFRQTATETVMPTISQPLNLSTNDFFDMHGFRPAISDAFTHYDFDEFYAGTTLGDLALTVPEPSCPAVLLAGAVITRYVRKRSRV